MFKIDNKEIIKKLKSRLRTQRRIFNFDNNQILVLPFLEHNDNILNSIEKIKFFINSTGEYLTMKDIKEIKHKSNDFIKVLNIDNQEFNLYARKLNGKLEKIKTDRLSFEDLTIDHTPSIQIVLYTMYLNKSEEFDILKNFSKNIENQKLTLTKIKSKGFKEFVKMNKLKTKEVDRAYNVLFNKIALEIVSKENNNANLSLISLDYYMENII